jgi:hypothetical protein
MPIELVWLGGLLVAAAGGPIFLFIQRRKPAELAYDLWHARGCPDGLPEDDFQAERQLLSRARPARPNLARPKRGPRCREDRDGAAAHLMLHGILVDGMIERIDGRPQYADAEIRKRREAGYSSAYLFAARNEQEFQRKKQAESGA